MSYQEKRRLFNQYENGELDSEQLDDALFEVESRFRGKATCPFCGGVMRFREHIGGWTCLKCGDTTTTSRLREDNLIVEFPR